MDHRTPLPWSRSCYVCGEANETGLQARSFKVGDRIELPFTAEERFAGWNGVIHGGLIATVLDEVMTWAAILASEQPCFAAEFTTRLLAPLPPGLACRAVARVSESRRRIFSTESWLEDEHGRVYARGHGRYMPVPGARSQDLREDFVSDESCLDLGGILGPD
jgi:acyl-coenzyme A thioesterase PaaI-like protein